MKYQLITYYKTAEAQKSKIAYVEKIFRQLNLNYSLQIGTDELSTEDIAQKLTKNNCDVVVCLGGDGTLHGIINGLYGKNIKLGIISLGHGNDMARSLGIPKKIKQAVQIIKQGKSEEFYLGKIQNMPTGEIEYFFSVVGMGFDVKVIETVEKDKLKDRYKSFAYNVGTIKALFSYRSPRIEIKYNNTVLQRKAMMVSIGNSTTYGGGMKITPRANPRKNYFNITYLRQMNIPTFLWHFPKVFSGKHIAVEKYVTNFNAKEIEIDDFPRGKIIADGELLNMLPAKISKAEHKQNIIIP